VLAGQGQSESGRPIGLTVIAPACDEASNIGPLVRRVGDACARTGRSFEFIVVDDASGDGTPDAVRAMMERHDWLRLVSLPKPEKRTSNGQSAAFEGGIEAARGTLIAMLDADLQNDPGDLPGLIETMDATGADLVQGDRTRARRAGDAWIRRIGSGVGRLARRVILSDPTRDTGCSLRVMTREVAAALPLDLRGMHRFIPVTARAMGFTVVEVEVSHGPRHSGTTKYGMGISSRAIPGLIDCFAVRWMIGRVWKPAARAEGRPPAPASAVEAKAGRQREEAVR